MASRRWRAVAALAGVGDSVYTAIPLLVIGPLAQPIEVAASALVAYTAGGMLSNVLVWGRLGDLIDRPRILALIGTVAQGVLLLVLAVATSGWSIVPLCAVIGVVAVSMDGAVARLVAGDLPGRERSAAFLVYSSMIERGLLIGFAGAAFVLPLLALSLSGDLALRVVITLYALAVLAQAPLIATGPVPGRIPRVTVGRVAASGIHLSGAGAARPFHQALRFVRGPRPGAGPRPLPDELRLFFVTQVVLHAGYALYGSILAIYLREEAGLNMALVMSLFAAGGITTNLALLRTGRWLVTVPAVQILAASASARVVLFLGFAIIALAPTAGWSLTALLPLYLLTQAVWGLILASGVAHVAELAPARGKARTMSSYGAASSTGVIIGTMAAGAIAGSFGFVALFASASAVVLVGLVLLMRW